MTNDNRIDPGLLAGNRKPAAGYHVNKEYPYKFTANAAPSVENIRGASVVRTGGYTRVYYADAEGRIVQVKNYDAAAGRFGARVEYNFDLDGRLIGELEPTGARRCIQYDRDSNAIRVAHLPAPGGRTDRAPHRWCGRARTACP